MSRYQKWAPYVPVAVRRKKAMLEMEKLRKKGHSAAPVVINGRAIATTFWGKAWCENLESYQDFENRLPRGRTYVRNGSVLDLQIASKEVRAMVSGSSIYQVKVDIKPLPQIIWQSICQDCSVGIDSLVELLQGRFNKGVMERLCRQNTGLFPRPSEITFSCSCPDYASMCKHIAAVLYGIGSRLDEKPELLFLLRAVDHNDLLVHLDMTVPLDKQAPATEKLLELDDLSNIFGIDMAEREAGSTESEELRRAADKRTPAKTIKLHPVSEIEREENVWQEIENLISMRNLSGYVKATARLLDLRNNAIKNKKMVEFSKHLATLRIRHKRKSRFILGLNSAGFE